MDLREEIAQSKDRLLSESSENKLGIFLSHFFKSVIILNFCYRLGYFLNLLAYFVVLLAYFVVLLAYLMVLLAYFVTE